MKENDFKTVESKASYAIGLQIGQQLQDSGLKDLDADAIAAGIRDVIFGEAPRLSLDSLHNALKQIHDKASKEMEEKAKRVRDEGKAFLEENRKKADVKQTDSGLQYKILKQGNGAKPTEKDRVCVHYTGRLTDGTVFDSSVQRDQAAEFPVNGVIPGWIEALKLMPVGSKWELYIPQELAYGERGTGSSIPPNSTLIFEVELLDILK